MLTNLPHDCLEEVYGYLDVISFTQLLRTSKTWRQNCQWKSFYGQRIWGVIKRQLLTNQNANRRVMADQVRKYPWKSPWHQTILSFCIFGDAQMLQYMLQSRPLHPARAPLDFAALSGSLSCFQCLLPKLPSAIPLDPVISLLCPRIEDLDEKSCRTAYTQAKPQKREILDWMAAQPGILQRFESTRARLLIASIQKWQRSLLPILQVA